MAVYMFKNVYQALIFVALLPGFVQAATYYVGTSGNDDLNSCETAKSAAAVDRKRTINGGIGCLNGGDTLVVGNGTYIEQISDSGCPGTCVGIPSGSAGAFTVIKAENIGGVIIKSNVPSGDITSNIFVSEFSFAL